MANDNTARDTDRAWDLMKKIGFAMMVTRDGEKLRAREARGGTMIIQGCRHPAHRAQVPDQYNAIEDPLSGLGQDVPEQPSAEPRKPRWNRSGRS